MLLFLFLLFLLLLLEILLEMLLIECDEHDTQEKEGFVFQSETDTEVVAKLALYFFKFLKSKTGHVPDFRSVVSKVTETIVSSLIFFTPLTSGTLHLISEKIFSYI
jgi:hypothetical protein